MARTVGMILTKGEAPAGRLVCSHCGREYKSAAALRAHVKEKHPDMLDEADSGEEQK